MERQGQNQRNSGRPEERKRVLNAENGQNNPQQTGEINVTPGTQYADNSFQRTEQNKFHQTAQRNYFQPGYDYFQGQGWHWGRHFHPDQNSSIFKKVAKAILLILSVLVILYCISYKFGFSLESFLKTWDTYYPKQHPQTVYGAMTQYVERKPVDFEYFFSHKDKWQLVETKKALDDAIRTSNNTSPYNCVRNLMDIANILANELKTACKKEFIHDVLFVFNRAIHDYKPCDIYLDRVIHAFIKMNTVLNNYEVNYGSNICQPGKDRFIVTAGMIAN